MQKDAALEAYMREILKAESTLDKLREYFVENHGDVLPDNVTWGHVGGIQYANAKLAELCEFVGISQ